MTARFFAAFCSLVVTGLCALSLGGRVFYLASYALLLIMLYSLVSVLIARHSLRISQQVQDMKVERGGSSKLELTLLNPSPLPIGPLELSLSLPDGRGSGELDAGLFKPKTASFPFFLPHVGLVPVGLKAFYLRDIFGLLRVKGRKMKEPDSVAVLPRPFEVEKLQFLMRDDGRAIPNRSTEDITSPEDTRAYREGDQLKRIHWKLSSRKRELLVRRFELPAPPDTLILMDCDSPVGHEGVPDGLSRLKDTLCETALSVARMQMRLNQPVRLPLYGARVNEFKADRAGSLALLQEELAYQIFRGGEPFPKVLSVELRRMRRTGACIVVTTRLDADIVEGIKHIRRSGPSVRFYLVTFKPDDPELSPFVRQMQRHLVEVCYVTPA